jgi:hypothetical protein
LKFNPIFAFFMEYRGSESGAIQNYIVGRRGTPAAPTRVLDSNENRYNPLSA